MAECKTLVSNGYKPLKFRTNDNRYQSTIIRDSSGKTFRKRNVLLFRNKIDSGIIFVNQSDSERSLFRLNRRIKQNREEMGKDFTVFLTCTYDNLRIYDAQASEQISKFVNDLHFKLSEKGFLNQYNDLKYLWKVEWGSHNKLYKNHHGKWIRSSGRIHIHLLLSGSFRPFDVKDEKYCNWTTQFRNNCWYNVPWFTKLWGRGIVHVAEIKPYFSKKKNRYYTKAEGVVYYLTKYFQKDYQSESMDSPDNSRDSSRTFVKTHKPLMGLTSRRWGTSVHYKTTNNPEWECLDAKTINNPIEERDLLESLFFKYVRYYHTYLNASTEQIIMCEHDETIWEQGEQITVHVGERVEYTGTHHDCHVYWKNKLGKMDSEQFRKYVKLMLTKYSSYPQDSEENAFSEDSKTLFRDDEYYQAKRLMKKREKNAKLNHREWLACLRTSPSGLLTPLEFVFWNHPLSESLYGSETLSKFHLSSIESFHSPNPFSLTSLQESIVGALSDYLSASVLPISSPRQWCVLMRTV